MAHVQNTNVTDRRLDVVRKDIFRPAEFQTLFLQTKQLGEGGDGKVYSYRHRETAIDIAVKIPSEQTNNRDLLEEIRSYSWVGDKNEHIVKVLGAFSGHAGLFGPALFLELCEMGDLLQYREDWGKQKKAAGRSSQPSEVTMWKLLKDMSLALDFLHNSFTPSGFVHNDVKPMNIFVCYPSEWEKKDGIPAEPVFKLGDFARTVRSPPMGAGNPWRGTPEYAPPPQEQMKGVKPSADIWALGATIQAFALAILPTESRQGFINRRKAEKQSAPLLDDHVAWNRAHWRSRRNVIFRPVSAPVAVLKTHYDAEKVSKDYVPYSSLFNSRYALLMESNEVTRITSRDLVQHVVPLIDGEVKLYKLRVAADNALREAAVQRGMVVFGLRGGAGGT